MHCPFLVCDLSGCMVMHRKPQLPSVFQQFGSSWPATDPLSATATQTKREDVSYNTGGFLGNTQIFELVLLTDQKRCDVQYLVPLSGQHCSPGVQWCRTMLLPFAVR